MADDPALRIDGLRKEFGGLVAVDDVSIEIGPDETASLIGPNGAGKTTMLNCMSGIYEPTAGSVYLGGTDVTGRPPHEVARAGLGRTYQITNIFEEYSVFENIRIAAQAAQGGNYDMLSHYATVEGPIETAGEVIERVNLADKHNLAAGVLAHGEQRQLEIALALASDPDVLLLDEPSAGMASDELARITDLIANLGHEYAILLVEHNIDLVMELSDSIIVLDQGAKIADGKPEAVRQDEAVLDAYLRTSTEFTEAVEEP